MSPDTTKTLFAYNRWANLKLLDTAEKITPAQLTEDFKLAKGSILETLAHILDVEWSWRMTAQQNRMPSTYIEGNDFPDIDFLRTGWIDEMDQMDAFLADQTAETLRAYVQYTRPHAQRQREQILWHILMHIINHSTHHRAEIPKTCPPYAQLAGIDDQHCGCFRYWDVDSSAIG